MSLTKDGFYKQIAGVKGDNTYLLLAGGGHQKLGNASGNVPISNGTLNVDLNADKLDGVHLNGIFTDFSGGTISSSGNTLTQTNHSITIGGTSRTAGSSTCNIINSNSLTGSTAASTSTSTYNLSITSTINGVSSTKNINKLWASQLNLIYCKDDSSPDNKEAWNTIKNGSSNTQTNKVQFYTIYGANTSIAPTNHGEMLEILSRNANHWQPQLWFGAGKNAHLYYRNKNYNDNTWGPWLTILDSNNYTSYVNNYYWANVKVSTTSQTNTYPQFGSLSVINDSQNNSTDGLVYFRHYSNNDWGLIVDKSQSYSYGVDIRAGGAYALKVGNGNTRLLGATIIGADATPSYTLDVRGTIRATSRIYANEWIEFSQAYTGLYWPNGNNASHFHPNDATTYGQFVLRGSRGGYSGITLARDANYMTIMDNSQDKGLYQQTGGVWIIYYRRDASRVGIRTSSDFGANININGTTHIRYSTLDNTAFKNILTIFGNNSNESSSESFTEGNASWGIGFQRQWSSGTATGICAGIFCVPSGSWRAGLAFRVKNNTTASNGAHDVTAIFISPKGSLLQQNYNNWLSPARTQIGRLDSSTYNDRSIIGTTSGNLHIDPYYNANAGTYSTYINYYSSAGYTYFNGGTYRITNGGHTYFAGYHHTGHDNNDAVLLAGGGWEYKSNYYRNLGGGNYITITVGGDANTYYPVVIGSPSDYYPYQFVNITRTYNETAPNTWNTSTHKGGLSMAIFWNGSSYWDGNAGGGEAFVVRLYQSYCTMVGGVDNCVGGKVVWLRGGGANYHIFSMNGRSQSATVYLSTYTDSASRSFAPRTSPVTPTVQWPGDIQNGAGYLRDRSNGTATYANYGAAGLGLGSITWLTCWNGYELRAISKGELGGLANVYQHTGNNVDYPLVWSNQNNTSTVQANQLHKSYADLVYNPANKEIKTWSFAPQGENTNRGIHFPGGAWINSIGTSIIFRNATIRFGGSGWDWNAWAGLNFDGNTTINIGMPNNSHWTANSNKTAGTIRTVSSKIEIFPDGNSNYGEGLRIHTASNGWTTLMLAGSDNTGFNGTSANSWSLHTNGGNFYLNRGSSNGQQASRLWGRSSGYTVGNIDWSSYTLEVADVLRVQNGIVLGGYSTFGTHYITGAAGRIYFGGNFHIDSIGRSSTQALYLNYYAQTDIHFESDRWIMDSEGKMRVVNTGVRRAGIYGVYDSYKIGHIWSMGTSFVIANDGSNFGNLYGLAYKHTNNGTGGTMAGGHQAVWCDNGSPRAAMGYNGFWAAGGFYKNGSSDTYVLLGGGGHQDKRRWTFTYNSANFTGSSGVTVNQMAADGNSNSHVAMIYAGTDNPVSSSGNWVHVWSQTWSMGVTSSWVSQIALGVQQGTGMWYRTTSGNIVGRGWTRVYDTTWHPLYWANVQVSDTSSTSTWPTFGSAYSYDWWRSYNATGWYNQSYGGGIWMTDSTWIRTYGSKHFYVEGGNFAVSGNAGIGTTSPSQKLHVAGNQYITGYINLNDHGYLMSGRSTSFNYGYSLSLGDSSQSMGMFSGPGGEEGAVIVSPDTCVIYNSFDQGWGFQVFDKDRGGNLTIDTSRVFGVNQANYFAWSRGGFWKEGSSDSYVLLGGGGHKAISDFWTGKRYWANLSVQTSPDSWTEPSFAKITLLGGSIEIHGTNPFIDFHGSNYLGDYRSRLINWGSNNRLTHESITSDFTGYLATVEGNSCNIVCLGVFDLYKTSNNGNSWQTCRIAGMFSYTSVYNKSSNDNSPIYVYVYSNYSSDYSRKGTPKIVSAIPVVQARWWGNYVRVVNWRTTDWAPTGVECTVMNSSSFGSNLSKYSSGIGTFTGQYIAITAPRPYGYDDGTNGITMDGMRCAGNTAIQRIRITLFGYMY